MVEVKPCKNVFWFIFIFVYAAYPIGQCYFNLHGNDKYLQNYILRMKSVYATFWRYLQQYCPEA